ncbi:MAG: purine-nucleoside phosphorylase [Candidatus Kapabacteria bacterium]|nr:purine-nucleoside phosphorylase [Candidatus Kapabacteria bacterium]
MSGWITRQRWRWEPTVEWLRARLPELPQGALIMGSGGNVVLRDKPLWECPYATVPGLPVPSVAGHPGVLGMYWMGRCWVLVFVGRFHLYEGYRVEEVVAPVLISSMLGIRWLVVTNAAGSVTRTHAPGDILLVREALNLSFHSVPIEREQRDFHYLFLCPQWRRSLRLHLEGVGLRCAEATYAAVLGPAYETPAEAHMLRCIGADVVGMSTVHELQCATALGVATLAISTVTNWATGLHQQRLAHAEVLAVLSAAAPRLYRVIQAAFQVLPGL